MASRCYQYRLFKNLTVVGFLKIAKVMIFRYYIFGLIQLNLRA